MSDKRIRFLNKEVEVKVTSNRDLFLMWANKYSPYECEIEPLHNHDWVRTAQSQELFRMNDLIQTLKELQSEYEEIELQAKMTMMAAHDEFIKSG